jgi:conjugative relaxase-like TrwC/TraI family protein
VGVLSLWKLRVGSESYYLSQVASGLEDYYAGRGEVAGVWTGHAAGALGLTGEVSGEDLQALLAGLAPGTGLSLNGSQLRPHPRRVPGFDLTFSVPKSVSVVYALGDPIVREQVVAAGEAAVSQTLGWLEREACFVRRGSNNRQARIVDPAAWGTRRLPGLGFVAAQFRHRSSRAGDPQLHWHLLVANATRGSDRRWSALDGQALYRSKRVAGAVFQAVLRDELTRRLGLEWTPVQDDVAEVAGVPRRVCRWFSKRRVEIEAELDRLGLAGPAAAAAATLATRLPAQPIDPAGLDADWREQAVALGWGPGELDRLLSAAPAPEVRRDIGGVPVAAVVDRLVEQDSTFTRHDAVRAVAALQPAATAADLERASAAVMVSPDVVALAASDGDVAANDERFTALRLLHCERRLIGLLTGGRQAGRGILGDSVVNAATARLGVEGEQQVAVDRLCRQGNAIEVLVGRAGTGKTTTVAAVAGSYRIAGWAVIGVAPSARAARELTHGAGIPAHTVPRFLRHLDKHPLDARTVVVMDEAGMAALSDLVTVLEAAATAGAKVILVGDPRQLPEVGPGGGLDAAIRLLGPQVCELTVNRRQREAWEIAALDELRHGDPIAAWEAYRQYGRVVTAELPADLRRQAVDDWWRNRLGDADSVLLAGTRAEVAALNRLARQRVADEGGLTGPSLVIGETTFQVGDRVLCTRNHIITGLGGAVSSVENGTVGTVIAIDHGSASLTMGIDRRAEHVELDVTYLAAGHLQHGYAMTVHKAQGVTVDHVHVVGPAGLYRESAYVGLSRARCGAVLYVTAAQAVELDTASHSRGIPLPGDHALDIDDQLLSRLQESRAKQLITWRYPNAEAVADLARQPLSALEQRLDDVRAVERQLQLTGHTDPAAARQAHDRAVRVRPQLAVGARVRALDWDNVGTIVDVQDHDGTAAVRFIGDRGTTTRSLPWSHLHPIGAMASPLPPAATDWLRDSGEQVVALERDWAEQLARHQVSSGEEVLLAAAVDLRQRRLGADLTARNPAWLTDWLGSRPEDDIGANVYDEIVETIAVWRDRLDVPDRATGLGLQPADEANLDRLLDAMETILRSRQWLQQRQPPTPATFTRLTDLEVNERIQSLEQLLPSAPPDCSKVVTALAAHHVDPDRQQALAAALAQQDARRSWILRNWPHVVEHHELQRLRAARTAAPDQGGTVSELLDRLSSLVSQDQEREDRSLFELRRSLEVAEPERQLVALTAALFQANDRLAVVTQQLTNNACSANSEDLLAEQARLTHERARLRTAVAEERMLASRAQLLGTDHRTCTLDAIAHREATLLRDVLAQRPPWLTRWLVELDRAGSLDQLPDHHLVATIGALASYRERWDVTSIDPTGDEPRPITEQHDQWRRIDQEIEPDRSIPNATPVHGR